MASLTAKAGTVVSLRLTEDGLQATARFADTQAGRLVWKLAQADALANSLSITVAGPVNNSVIRNGELTEISVVYLGMDSRSLYVSKNNFQPEGNTIMHITENLEQQKPEWKDSREGMAAFALAILHHPNDELGVKDEWRSQLAAHSYDLSGTENLIPAPVVTGITNAFHKGVCGLYPLLTKMSMESWTLIENMVDPSAAAENYSRSNGSRKVKSELLAQYVEVAHSDIMRLEVAHGNIMRLADSPADLMQYISEELPNRLVNTIEKGVLFPVQDATGTQAAFHDVFTDATGTPDSLAAWLAGSMEAAGATPTIGDLIDLDAMVTADGERVLITSCQTLATINRSIAGNGNFIGLSPNAAADILGVKQVITPAWWDDSANLGALAIIMVPSHYLLVGGDVNSYAQFTLDNTDEFRSRTDKFWSRPLVGGSLDSAHAAAVLTPKA